MIITNHETGATHEEPICRTGCGAFEAAPNPLCAGQHGSDTPDVIMRRICSVVGHIPGAKCLRCNEAKP